MPGAVENSAYRAWGNIKLPKYFLKLHLTAPNPVKIGKIWSLCVSPAISTGIVVIELTRNVLARFMPSKFYQILGEKNRDSGTSFVRNSRSFVKIRTGFAKKTNPVRLENRPYRTWRKHRITKIFSLRPYGKPNLKDYATKMATCVFIVNIGEKVMEKVVIIDDNRSSDELEIFLRNRGYFPISVDTVDEGLRNINASENLKIILLNAELSAERGWDALKRIKREHPEIIVIVIGAGVQTARRAVSLGVLEVLSHVLSHNDEKFYRALDQVFERLSIRSNTLSTPKDQDPAEVL